MVAFTIAEIIPVPVANERADNAYDQIADESKAGPSYYFAGQPASNKANHQYDQETLILKYARCLLRGQPVPYACRSIAHCWTLQQLSDSVR
jgi:hypothetical protein